jgi:hypothetical protein
VLRIVFTAEDFARTTMTSDSAPPVELKLSLMMLCRRDGSAFFGRWLRGLKRSLPATTRPLWDLISPFLGPAFLDPVSETLPEGLAVLEASPPELVWAGSSGCTPPAVPSPHPGSRAC